MKQDMILTVQYVVNSKAMERSLLHFLYCKYQVAEAAEWDRFLVRTPVEARLVTGIHDWLSEGNCDLKKPPITSDEAMWKMNILVYSDGNGNESSDRTDHQLEWTVMVQG